MVPPRATSGDQESHRPRSALASHCLGQPSDTAGLMLTVSHITSQGTPMSCCPEGSQRGVWESSQTGRAGAAAGSWRSPGTVPHVADHSRGR